MSRKIKVGYRWILNLYGKGKCTPKITIQGDYLKQAGFDVGTSTIVLIENNRIIIETNG